MRKQDLAVGTAYYYQHGKYHDGQRAVVIDLLDDKPGVVGIKVVGPVDPARPDRQPWVRGIGMLKVGDQWVGIGEVRVSDLRGPWDAMHAADVERAEAERQRQDAADAAKALAAARLAQALGDIQPLLAEYRPAGSLPAVELHGTTRVRVDLGLFCRLADVYDLASRS